MGLQNTTFSEEERKMDARDHIHTYLSRTRRSRELFERASRVMPGGVSHRYRFIAPYPFFIQEAQGSRIKDVDGNEYVDLWMGHFALILGHKSHIAQQALEEAFQVGTHWGIVHEYEVKFAELIQEIVPCAERLVFGVSGTEATMYAVRLARAFTNRAVIMKVEGGWHGANSELLWAVKPPYQVPESAGLVPGIERFVKAIPFNDIEGTMEAIREAGDDLAGVIVEPLVGAGGFLPADSEYLHMLREETRKRGALLIFDEIITGFRLSLKGAQGVYGIVPDLATLGKVVGGGLNLGIVAGRADVMSLCDPTASRPKGQGVVIGGGTFSCSPISMIVGYRVVKYLKDNEGSVYPAIDAKGERLRRGMVEAFESCGLSAVATGMGSLCGLYFPRQGERPAKTPREIQELTDVELLDQEFRIRMMNHGVFVMHGGGAVSTAHTDEDIKRILTATREVAREIARTR